MWEAVTLSCGTWLSLKTTIDLYTKCHFIESVEPLYHETVTANWLPGREKQFLEALNAISLFLFSSFVLIIIRTYFLY